MDKWEYPDRWFDDVTANFPALNSELGFASVLDSNTHYHHFTWFFDLLFSRLYAVSDN